jgi:hypothetical protein
MRPPVRRLAPVLALAVLALAAPLAARAVDPPQKQMTRSAAPAQAAGSAALEQRVAALESQLAALKQAVQVAPSGDVSIVGQNLKLEASKGLHAKASQGVIVEAGSTLTTKAGSNATHQAGATLDLKGSMAKVPDQTTKGGKTLATVGSPVMGACPPNGGPLAAGQVLP